MRSSMLYRLAIPLLLALLPAAIFFRFLLLLVLVMAFGGFLLLVSRMSGNRMGEVGETARAGKKIIDSSYKIVDDSEKPPK
ncbi:MAG: hypothetical protein HY672_02815 [Chloroflexi bacterium]|nr:hypothetical protein [Chloroflexota bacterium]